MNDLKIYWPPIFLDYFQYQGTLGLPGSATLPEHWTVLSGAFTTKSERYLECTEYGELLYSGTDLSELAHHQDTAANYAFVTRFYGQEDLAFSIKVRRQSATRYLSLLVDFAAQTISLFSVNGVVSTILSTMSYNLRSADVVYYSIEFWLHGTNGIVYVNGSPVIEVSSLPDDNCACTGFSLSVTDGLEPRFAKFAVHETTTYPDPTAEHNLYWLARINMKDAIETPSIKNYTEFMRARKLWLLHRNEGYSNETWADLGYPIREPLPEEWLVNP